MRLRVKTTVYVGILTVIALGAGSSSYWLLRRNGASADYIRAPVPPPPSGTLSSTVIGNSVMSDDGSFLQGTGKDLTDIAKEPKFSGFFGDLDVTPSGDSVVMNYASELTASNVVYDAAGKVLGRAGQLGGTAVALSDQRQWTGGCAAGQSACSPGPEGRHTIFTGNSFLQGYGNLHLTPPGSYTFCNLYTARLSSEPYPQADGGSPLPGCMAGAFTEYAKWNNLLKGDPGWDAGLSSIDKVSASSNLYPQFQDVTGLAVTGNLLFVAVDQDRNAVSGGKQLTALQTATWVPGLDQRDDSHDRIWMYDLAAKGAPNPSGAYRLLGSFALANIGKMAANPGGKTVWALQRSKDGGPTKAILLDTDPASAGYGTVVRSFQEKGWDPTDIAVDPRNGNVLVSDAGSDRQIKAYTASGQLAVTFGVKGGVFQTSDGAVSGEFRAGAFNDPRGVGIDAAGNLYVLDGIRGGRGGTYQSFAPEGNSWKRDFRWVQYNVTDWDTPIIDPQDPTTAYTAYVKLRYAWPTDPAQQVGWKITNYLYNPDLNQMDWRAKGGITQNLQQVVYLNGKRFLELTSGTFGRMYYFRFDGEIAVPAALITIPNRPENYAPGMVEAAPDLLVQKVAADKFKRLMWSDANGDGKLSADEVTLSAPLKAIDNPLKMNMGDWQGAYVDANGDFWMPEQGSMVRSKLKPQLLASGAPAWDLGVSDADRFPWPATLLPGQPPAIYQYDAATDSMYIAGGVTSWAACGNRPEPSLIKMTGYTSGTPKIAWTRYMGHFLIYNEYRDTSKCPELTGYARDGITPLRLGQYIANPPAAVRDNVLDPNGEFNPPIDFDVAGNYVFMARMNGTGGDVVSADTGEYVGMIASPRDGTGWLDQPQHANAAVLPNGTYAFSVLSVTNHRTELFQWVPPNDGVATVRLPGGSLRAAQADIVLSDASGTVVKRAMQPIVQGAVSLPVANGKPLANLSLSLTLPGRVPIRRTGITLASPVLIDSLPPIADLNADGRVSLTDVVTAIRWFNSSDNPPLASKLYANGRPNLGDITAVIKAFNEAAP